MPFKDPAKRAEAKRRWRIANPEKQRAASKAWKASHPDEVRGHARTRYHRDPERWRLKSRQYSVGHPEVRRAAVARRRAWKAGAAGSDYTTHEHVEGRIALFGGMCAYCGVRPHEQVDHVVPLSKGGSHWPANLRPSCASCNNRKSAAVWERVVF